MKTYKINILIYNDHGELVDKQFIFGSLDEMRNLDINKVVDEAETYGKEEGMLYEELFDSKEEAEMSVGGVDFSDTFEALDNLKIR